MTDNEILRILSCNGDCYNCPYEKMSCHAPSPKDIYDLIKRQQAEIERLRNQVKLLEAKKPTHEASLYISFTCPSCKNVVDESTTLNGKKCRILVDHCKYCGQKLDWEGVFADE